MEGTKLNIQDVVADRLANVPFAEIRKVAERATQLETQGKKIIHFEIGRPDFDTPEHIKAAAIDALNRGFVHYPPNNGIPALREAMAARLQADKNLTYDPQTEILVTAGGQEALYLTFMSILNPGDEVMVPEICFGPFPLVVALAGGTPVHVPLQADNHYAYDLAAAKQALSPRAKAILVNSPHNPTGGVLTEGQLREVAAFAAENDLLLILDDAYDQMIYEGKVISPAAFPGMRERTIICGTLSKTYAMTGWRIGYIAAMAPIVHAATKMQQNVLLSVCSFAQHGAVAGLTGPQDCVRSMMTEFDRRRRLVLDLLRKAPGLEITTIPEGAFYVFPRITLPHVTSAQVAEYLLEEAGVAVVDGRAFGEAGNGHFRISYAVSYEDCREGLERIVAAMGRLAKSAG